MQTHLADWYKILDLETHPSESEFEKRNLVLNDIRKLVMGGTEWNQLIACVAGVAGGFEVLGEEIEYTQKAIQCHKSHLLSFPSNLVDNSLALRVASGVIIEEIITGDIKDQNGNLSIEPSVVALLLLSAFGLVTKPTEKYLTENLNRLKLASENYLEKKARELRQRQPLDYSSMEEMSVPPDATTWTSLRDQILDMFREIEQKAAADREEVELLWWLHNGFSKKLKQPFVNLPPISAAIYAGLEVSEMVILPSIESTFFIVRKAVENSKSKQGNAAKPIPQWVTRKEISTWTLLSPTSSEIQEDIRACPSVFPFSWLGLRLKESKGTAGWEIEFKKRTGVSIEKPFTPAEIGEQVFREQIAMRSLLNIGGSGYGSRKM
jgi:hypothetical protein